MEKKRPTSITIISWILIVGGLISLITITLNSKNPNVQKILEQSPVPIYIQYILSYVSIIISLISCFVMLKGKNWGRYTYVVWGALNYIFNFIVSPMKVAMIPGILVFIIITFFLFRPKSNNYFIESVTDIK